ncbi:MaoC family dehydratase [Azospirillum doebereinerae]
MTRGFATFQPGDVVGTGSLLFDEAALETWCAIFPDDRALAPAMPPGMTAMVTMRVYMDLLDDRPPGNIHASQSVEMLGPVVLGDRLTTTLVCAGKEERNGRRWLDFVTDTRNQTGAPVFRGRKRIIWGA